MDAFQGKGEKPMGKREKTSTTLSFSLVALPYWLFPHPRPYFHTANRPYFHTPITYSIRRNSCSRASRTSVIFSYVLRAWPKYKPM